MWNFGTSGDVSDRTNISNYYKNEGDGAHPNKVYLLSYEEVMQYSNIIYNFNYGQQGSTPYVINHYFDGDEDWGMDYMLRTPEGSRPASFGFDGIFTYQAASGYSSVLPLRVQMWITIPER